MVKHMREHVRVTMQQVVLVIILLPIILREVCMSKLKAICYT
jgi:hypothetical protein